MPLITPILEQHGPPAREPNTSAALELVGLSKSKTNSKEQGLVAKLRDHNLDTESLLSNLSSLVHNATSEALQLRAIEDAMKLNPETRVMDSKPEVPIVNIIINDSNVGVNPILYPRESFS